MCPLCTDCGKVRGDWCPSCHGMGAPDTILLVVGLPGSGKSMMFKGMNNAFDDIRDLSILPKSGSFIVIDHFFCDLHILNAAKSIMAGRYPNHEVSVLYFANDPEQAAKNANNRDTKVLGEIARMTQLYNPPTGAIPIWRAT